MRRSIVAASASPWRRGRADPLLVGDASAFHREHAVGKRHGLRDVMRDESGGEALVPPDPGQQRLHLDARQDIERAEHHDVELYELARLHRHAAEAGGDRDRFGDDQRRPHDAERVAHPDKEEPGLPADAEPHDDQRDQRQMRHVAHHPEARVEPRLGHPRQTVGEAEREADRRADGEAAEGPPEADRPMIRDLPVAAELRRRRADGERRGQDVARDSAGAGRKLPGKQHRDGKREGEEAFRHADAPVSRDGAHKACAAPMPDREAKPTRSFSTTDPARP